MAAITLVLGLVFTQARAFAALPDAQTENPNLTAGRKAIEAKEFKSAVGSLRKPFRKTRRMPTLTPCSVTVIANSAPSTNRWTITRWLLKIDANHRSAQEYLGELYLDMNQPANAEKQLQVLKKSCPFIGKCARSDDLKVAIKNHKPNNSRSPADSKESF